MRERRGALSFAAKSCPFVVYVPLFSHFVSLLFRHFMLFRLLTGDVAFCLHRAPSFLTVKRNERVTWHSLIRRKRESAAS